MPAHETEVFRPGRFDKALLASAAALLAAGVLMVYDTSGMLSAEKYNHQFYYLIHQLIGAGVGLALVLLFLTVRKPLYQTPAFVLGLLLLTLILLVACFAMPSHANTNRIVEFGPLRFQPSELAKVSLILFLAYVLDKKKERLREVQTWLVPLAVPLLVFLLIIKEPDYGTAVLVLAVSLAVLFLGGLKLRVFSILGLVGLALLLIYLFAAPYRLERVRTFLSPDRDPMGQGFQIRQSKLAVGRGGLMGVSFGMSTQKLYFLPCAHTDFIYAIVGEEFGLWGTLGVLSLFLIILWRGLVISRRAPDFFSQVAAAGLTLMITLQALINITVVLGLGPVKGIPLPLVSYGRSSLISTLMAVGILLHISQRKVTEGGR